MKLNDFPLLELDDFSHLYVPTSWKYNFSCHDLYFPSALFFVDLPFSIFLSNHFSPEPTNLATYPIAKTSQDG